MAENRPPPVFQHPLLTRARPKLELTDLDSVEQTHDDTALSTFVYFRGCSRSIFTLTSKSAKVMVHHCDQAIVRLQNRVVSGTVEVNESNDITMEVSGNGCIPTLCLERSREVDVRFESLEQINKVLITRCTNVRVFVGGERVDTFDGNPGDALLAAEGAVREGCGVVTTAKAKTEADELQGDLSTAFDNLADNIIKVRNKQREGLAQSRPLFDEEGSSARERIDSVGEGNFLPNSTLLSPTTFHEVITERVQGALLLLACGDAVGGRWGDAAASTDVLPPPQGGAAGVGGNQGDSVSPVAAINRAVDVSDAGGWNELNLSWRNHPVSAVTRCALAVAEALCKAGPACVNACEGAGFVCPTLEAVESLIAKIAGALSELSNIAGPLPYQHLPDILEVLAASSTPCDVHVTNATTQATAIGLYLPHPHQRGLLLALAFEQARVTVHSTTAALAACTSALFVSLAIEGKYPVQEWPAVWVTEGLPLVMEYVAQTYTVASSSGEAALSVVNIAGTEWSTWSEECALMEFVWLNYMRTKGLPLSVADGATSPIQPAIHSGEGSSASALGVEGVRNETSQSIHTSGLPVIPPPPSGDLFSWCMNPDSDGFYEGGRQHNRSHPLVDHTRPKRLKARVVPVRVRDFESLFGIQFSESSSDDITGSTTPAAFEAYANVKWTARDPLSHLLISFDTFLHCDDSYLAMLDEACINEFFASPIAALAGAWFGASHGYRTPHRGSCPFKIGKKHASHGHIEEVTPLLLSAAKLSASSIRPDEGQRPRLATREDVDEWLSRMRLILDSPERTLKQCFGNTHRVLQRRGFERPPGELVPGFLYLGDHHHATNVELLDQIGITHIINCASGWVHTNSSFYGGTKQFLGLKAEDDEGFPLMLRFWKRSKAFLDECRNAGGKALVHCMAGINRSGCIAIAYMISQGIGLEEALVSTRLQRYPVLCNEDFQRQVLFFANDCDRLEPAPGTADVVLENGFTFDSTKPTRPDSV